MSLLIYSRRCQHCMNIIQFIENNPPLGPMVRYHNVNELGIPEQHRQSITSVPTLLTSNGKMLVGQEVKSFLESLLPSEISQYNMNASSLGGDADYFDLSSYGQSLQPPLTSDLENKIKANVKGGTYSELKER